MQLGQILLQKKWISSHQLEQTMHVQQAEKQRIGEILVKQGYIVSEQLDLALREQYWRRNGFWVID